MSYILYLILPFWGLHILRRSLFWLYFWQLKEYRFDRFFDGIRANKRILFPVVSIFSFLLVVFSPLFSKIEFSFGRYYLTGFEVLVFLLYLFFGLYSFVLLFKKAWALPKFTFKMVFLFVFTIAMIGILFFEINPSLEISIFALSAVVFEIFFIPFILLSAGIFQVPIFFAKKWIIRRAKEKMKRLKNLTVIGITGSYGKTSTKEFLAQILSLKYKVLKTKGNTNTEIGVANTVLKDLTSDYQVFICEMAAYKKGEIKAICDIVHPKIGILTGISQQHISLFGTLKNIINTKYELIESLPPEGIAIFNGANKECLKLSKRCNLKKKIYSIPEGDVFATNIYESKDFVEFDMIVEKKKERIRLNLLGKQNIENFLGAVACALELGISLSQIKKIAPKIKGSDILMQKKKGKNGAIIIDDSYSQNPDGVLMAIDYLKNYKRKKVIVMPCLIELGRSSPSIHKKIGEEIGKTCDLAIITTGYYFEELKIGAMSEGMKKDQILFLDKTNKILEKLKPYLKRGNVILIEGRVPKKLIKEITT